MGLSVLQGKRSSANSLRHGLLAKIVVLESTDAFSALANSNQLQLLDRYKTKLHRAGQRALNNLMLFHQFPRDEEPFPEPNEPIIQPVPEPEPIAKSADLPNEPENQQPAQDPQPDNTILPNEPKVPQPSANQKVEGDDDDNPYAGYPRFEIKLGIQRPWYVSIRVNHGPNSATAQLHSRQCTEREQPNRKK